MANRQRPMPVDKLAEPMARAKQMAAIKTRPIIGPVKGIDRCKIAVIFLARRGCMAEPDHPSERSATVIITDELLRRPPAKPDYLREKQAIQDLAQQMADRPTEIIPRLVALAMEICDGVSAGVSVLDPETNRFRWVGVQGALAAMQGVTVPRENSPAGVCMDIGGPVLMGHPGRAFGWMQGGAVPVSELLLVPLQSKGAAPLGTLWVIAKEAGHFDSGHARSMSDHQATGKAGEWREAGQRHDTTIGRQD
jgi:hypothetical protein